MIKHLKRRLARRHAAGDLSRLYSSEHQRQPLQSWRDQSPEYQEHFLHSVEVMAGLEALAQDADIQAAADQPAKRVGAVEKARDHWGQWVVVASALLVMVIGFDTWRSAQQAANDVDVLRYVTQIGEQKTVALPDGSAITLNTGTELLVEMGESRRRITLQRGEAYFAVTRDQSRPFSVNTGLRSVTVLGTEFNLLKTPDSFSLAVVEGVVAVHQPQDRVLGDEPLLEVASGEKTQVSANVTRRITAGTVVEYSASNQQITAYNDPNISRLQQWRTGQLRFEYEPLYKVVKELNRYSAKKILIEDDAIMNMKIFALVNLDRLDYALLGLETTMPIKVTKYFDRIVIVGEEKP